MPRVPSYGQKRTDNLVPCPLIQSTKGTQWGIPILGAHLLALYLLLQMWPASSHCTAWMWMRMTQRGAQRCIMLL